MKTNFKTAEKAFEYFYDYILKKGAEKNGTKYIRNVKINIKNPNLNEINTRWRKWSIEYAKYEFDWYKSMNRSVSEIGKKAKIWLNIADENGNVNSNYGYQWSRNNQIDYVLNELSRDNNTRRACLTIFDGKESSEFKKDTPCTLNICFNIENNKLNMDIIMRSNDLYFGFCNDQYCFSMLQQEILYKLNSMNNKLKLGTYTHYVLDLHIYEKHYYSKKKFNEKNN
jgi:thymidylate synthase